MNEYIVGQNDAKKKVAIALRNRYRRSQLDEEMKQEIVPKNILMIGPTGVGKLKLPVEWLRLSVHLLLRWKQQNSLKWLCWKRR